MVGSWAPVAPLRAAHARCWLWVPVAPLLCSSCPALVVLTFFLLLRGLGVSASGDADSDWLDIRFVLSEKVNGFWSAGRISDCRLVRPEVLPTRQPHGPFIDAESSAT